MVSKLILILLLVGIMGCSCNPGAGESPPKRDRFKISLMWPNSYCWSNNANCRSSIPQFFVIKSLWVENNNSISQINCPTTMELLDDSISHHKYDLLKYWPDLSTYNYESSKKLWKDQWKTYGSCCASRVNMIPESYITAALNKKQIFNMLQILKSAGIVPMGNGKTYPPKNIFLAIKKVTRVSVDIVCEADVEENNILLSEIHLCFDDEGTNLVDCDHKSINCDSDPIFPDSLYD